MMFILHDEVYEGRPGYRVGGLPDGTTARIAYFGSEWRVMRVVDDSRPADWSGHYASAEDALAALRGPARPARGGCFPPAIRK